MAFPDFAGDSRLATNGIAFILPTYDALRYAQRAALSFFKYTPADLNPVLLLEDDCSPTYELQDWELWYEDLPRDRCWHHHFPTNHGLTRSWNAGLTRARDLGCAYAITGNSDILFTEGWYEGLIYHLTHGVALVGPVTNTPGWTRKGSQAQSVTKCYAGYRHDDDSPEYLNQVAGSLRATYPHTKIDYGDINGFFMMSTVAQWWRGRFDDRHVFNPAMKLAGNEDELEKRWRRKSWRVGFVPSSFVYHYRSVSRGKRHKTKGAHRLSQENANRPV